MKVSSGYADVDGTRLYYELAGEGDPVVLIHGNFGDRRHWDDQFSALAEGCTVLRYDCRGFGKSSMPVEGELYSHHDDLKVLMSHLAISEASICGVSMGCAIAVDFVLVYPEMSRSLIAVGPWASGYTSPKAEELYSEIRKIPNTLKEKGPEEALDHVWDYIFAQKLGCRGDLRLRENGKDYSFWHYINEDPAIGLRPSAALQLGKISVPTLIVTAEYDIPSCIEIAELMERDIPNSQKAVFKNASHFMNIDEPEVFIKIVLDFIGNL
jgi:pimeloyl-ACP methyl ester carboxylesterase